MATGREHEVVLPGSMTHVVVPFKHVGGGLVVKGEKLTGRTRGNRAVNVAGPDSLIGSLANVRITSAGANSLAGDLCG